MTMPTVARSWRYPTPSERMTWAEVYAEARSIPGAESDLIFSDQSVKDAVKKAVGSMREHAWRHESWTSTLAEAPMEGIQLPWAPTGIVMCSWKLIDDQNQYGQMFQPDLYQVTGDVWRWLGDECLWPGGTETLQWAMEVTGRPTRPEIDTYCSIPIELLMPFIELEVTCTINILDGAPRGKTLKETADARQIMLRQVRTPQRPATITQGENSSASGFVVFQLWGDTHYTFDDLP